MSTQPPAPLPAGLHMAGDMFEAFNVHEGFPPLDPPRPALLGTADTHPMFHAEPVPRLAGSAFDQVLIATLAKTPDTHAQ